LISVCFGFLPKNRFFCSENTKNAIKWSNFCMIGYQNGRLKILHKVALEKKILSAAFCDLLELKMKIKNKKRMGKNEQDFIFIS
jgi:hypothetical protein